jgi:hypothetical protein
VLVTASAIDLTAVTFQVSLDDAATTFPLPVGREGAHRVSVTATDALGWSATATSAFTADTTAPQITLLANGVELSAGATFDKDVTLTWQVADANPGNVTVLLDSAPVTSGVVVSADALHSIVITAVDRAGNRGVLSRGFTIDRVRPSVRLLANGAAFVASSWFRTPVTFAIDSDKQSDSVSATIDGQPHDLSSPLAAEGAHNVEITLKFGGQTVVVGPFAFSIDTTPPVITLKESGELFRDGMKFSRDVLPLIEVTDALTPHPETVVLLDGGNYPAGIAISQEKPVGKGQVSVCLHPGERDRSSFGCRKDISDHPNAFILKELSQSTRWKGPGLCSSGSSNATLGRCDGAASP